MKDYKERNNFILKKNENIALKSLRLIDVNFE